MVYTLLVRNVAIVGLAAVLSGCQCQNEYTWDGQTAPAELENDHGQWLSMDVAPNGDLAVTYYDRTRGGIGFARGETKSTGEVWWSHERVDGYPDENGLNPGDRGKFTSMKVGPTGEVWAAYQDVDNGSLRVAKRTGGTWESEVADIGGGLAPNAGEWASLALDADANPVVAHYDNAKGTLRVARYDGSAWSGGEVHTGQPFSGVDGGGNAVNRPASVGMYARLMIHENTEFIAFYDAAQQTLNLLEGFPGAYTHTVVHSTGNVGQWPSMWTDGTDLLIAFHDVGNQDLLLARRTGGGSFTVSVVDDAEYVGADTEVFMMDGKPAIVYFDGHENDMLLAVQKEDGSWDLQQLGGDEVAVGYHNEVAYTNGQWWTASYNYTDRNIFARPL